MSHAVAFVAEAAAGELWALRAHTGIEASVGDGGTWLRARRDDAQAVAGLRALPDTLLFETFDGTRLARRGGRVPVRDAPAGPWQPLGDLSSVERPETRLPATADGVRPARVTLVRSLVPRPAGGLLTTLTWLAAFAHRAPAMRLAPLRFAAGTDGTALLLGTPLPPLPGTLLHLAGRLALPCGHDLAAPLTADVAVRHLAVQLGAGADDVIVLTGDGRCRRAGAMAILPCTRAAILGSLPQPSTGP